MNEETLWTRAYGDEYSTDVTPPLFFSLLGEYLTEYVNQEGARIMAETYACLGHRQQHPIYTKNSDTA